MLLIICRVFLASAFDVGFTSCHLSSGKSSAAWDHLNWVAITWSCFHKFWRCNSWRLLLFLQSSWRVFRAWWWQVHIIVTIQLATVFMLNTNWPPMIPTSCQTWRQMITTSLLPLLRWNCRWWRLMLRDILWVFPCFCGIFEVLLVGRRLIRYGVWWLMLHASVELVEGVLVGVFEATCTFLHNDSGRWD